MTDNTDFYTVTMAKIFTDQGHFDRAAEIYRYLLKAAPDREDLAEALEAVEKRAATAPKKDFNSLVPLLQEWIELLLLQKNIHKLKALGRELKK